MALRKRELKRVQKRAQGRGSHIHSLWGSYILCPPKGEAAVRLLWFSLFNKCKIFSLSNVKCILDLEKRLDSASVVRAVCGGVPLKSLYTIWRMWTMWDSELRRGRGEQQLAEARWADNMVNCVNIHDIFWGFEWFYPFKILKVTSLFFNIQVPRQKRWNLKTFDEKNSF